MEATCIRTGGTTQAANFTVGCFFCIRALMGISAGCAYKLRYGLRRCVVAFWSKVEAWQCRSRRGSERINVSALTTSQQSRFAADGQPLRLASEPLPLYRADARHRGRHCRWRSMVESVIILYKKSRILA